jgi:hypothetical protein
LSTFAATAHEKEAKQKKEEIKNIKEEAKKALLEYDQPINQFPRILEQASTSVTAEHSHLKAWLDQQRAKAKKIKTELHSKLIDLLDFSTGENQAVFWTGYPDGNQTLAIHFSKESNKKTLEMTFGGQFLDDLNLYGKNSFVSIPLADALFDLASEKFARGAMGEIHAFLPYVEPRVNSVFKRIEEPILREKEASKVLSLMLRKKPKYEYWRTIAEGEEYNNIYEAFEEEVSKVFSKAVVATPLYSSQLFGALSIACSSCSNALASTSYPCAILIQMSADCKFRSKLAV